MESKITILTEDRRFSLKSDKTIIDDLFCKFIFQMIGDLSTEEVCDEIYATEDNVELANEEISPEPNRQDGVTGFLYFKCEGCGHMRGLNAKSPINKYVCEKCGTVEAINPEKMKPLIAKCECGKTWVYRTQIEDQQFEVKCIVCDYPISVEYNARHNRYETIK